MTITIDEEVYNGLHRLVKKNKISKFVEELLRPHIVDSSSLEAGYRAMAADTDREKMATEWINSLAANPGSSPSAARNGCEPVGSLNVNT